MNSTTLSRRKAAGSSHLCLAITERAPLPMVAMEGAAHLVSYVNPAFCRLMDKPTEQLVGKPFCELMPEKDECLTRLDSVYRTGKPETYTESRPLGIFWSYTMWAVIADKRPVGVMIQVTIQATDTARLHEQTVAMNEALMLGALRQHELTEVAENLNAQLQVEITERKRTEGAQRRMNVLAASNRKLKQEIVRRQAVEEALRKSEQHSGHLLEQSRHMQDRLRLLSRQVLSAQEEERKKISRELHDVVAQTLTSINVRLANLKKEALSNTRGLDRNIARTQRLVEQSVGIVHRFARELRPTVLDDLGLIPALHTFLKSFREQTGIRVSLSAFAAVEKMNGYKRTVLYRVAQEALTNVARHAQASRAEVKIQKLEGAICMKIKDDGKGFPAERVLHAKQNKRLGLLGMRERLEMVGGKFAVESAPGKGTTVLAQIPLLDRAQGREEKALIAFARTKL